MYASYFDLVYILIAVLSYNWHEITKHVVLPFDIHLIGSVPPPQGIQSSIHYYTTILRY